MAEVLVQFDRTISDRERHEFVPRVCGRGGEDGRWEGWIEFEPTDGGPILRTQRETKQPNRQDLDYWATGLTMGYLEGALHRAQTPRKPPPRPRPAAEKPVYDRPAPSSEETGPRTRANRIRPRGVLDPFRVYAQSGEMLRQELNALSESHLRNIVRAYDLVEDDEVDLDLLHRVALADLIVGAVRKRTD